jgi:hypothetical protein
MAAAMSHLMIEKPAATHSPVAALGRPTGYKSASSEALGRSSFPSGISTIA